MNPNSINSHQLNLSFDKYTKGQDKVIKALEVLNEGTMHEIAKHLGVELNRCSGRFKELIDKGAIEVTRTKKIGSYNYSVYKIKSI